MILRELNESTVRSKARRMGYIMRKSREWKHVPNCDNYGEFMLVEAERNIVVYGERFDATLGDIWEYLSED